MADELEITIASHPRWLRVVRQMVREFAREVGFTAPHSDAITLAVDEAVGNVIKHAYKGRTDARITLTLTAGRSGVEVRVRDAGEPFDPLARATPAPDELRAGGRGLYLIREIMDEIEYDRENGDNVFRMRKALETPAASEN